MAREIKQKNLFELISQSAKEIGYKTLSAYAFMIVLFVVIAVTFLLAQQRQNLQQNASYDAATKTFSSTFGGNPPTPQPFTHLGQNDWDIQIHTRQPNFWYTLEGLDAQHGHDCGAPPATHHVNAYEDVVFHCRDHVMTSLNASDYGVIYMTPNALVDWSGGEATIQWEMSTARQSVRDWPDVWITPYDKNLALPLDNGLPDLQGPPPTYFHVSFNTTETAPLLDMKANGTYRDFDMAGWNVSSARGDIASGTNQAATRQTFKLTISSTKAKFERLASATGEHVLFWEKTFPNVGFTQGVVQFGHHSYTPTKDNSGTPGTWHWDNVVIKPSVPLTFIKADKRYVDGSGGTVTFNSPAPANSYLRFGAIGNIRVNGSSVNPQPTDGGNEFGEHFKSYFVPIPEGTTQVTLAMTQSSSYPAFARDFAIWSKTVQTGNTPPTNTPAPQTQPSPTPNVPTATNPPNPPSPTPTTVVTPTSVPANSVLSIDPATRSVVRGDTFSAQVKVNTNGQTINGVEAGITYPSQLLDIVSIAGNTTIFDVEAENTIGSGRINLAYGATTPRSGSGLTVATITFMAKAAGTATLSFTSDSAIVSNISNTNVSRQATGATYTITAPTPTPTKPPTPTATPIPTATPTPVAKVGDLNGDNRVNVQDLSYLLSKWGRSDAIADINKDGRVNTLDLSILLSNWGR